MVLVDPRMLEDRPIPCAQQPIADPVVTKLCDLDSQMQTILQTPNIPSSEKVLLYKDTLQKYLSYADKYVGHPKYSTPPTTNQQPAPPTVNTTPELSAMDQQVIDSVPPTFTRKARLLLNHFKKIPELSWNDKGELIYQQQRIANSSMIDIVNDLMRSRKQRPAPIGWDIIKKLLKESNAPRELISHDARWRSMQSQIPVRTPKQRLRYSSDSDATPIAATTKKQKKKYRKSPVPTTPAWLSFDSKKNE